MPLSRSAPDPLRPGPLGFAHRGLHGPGIPENSLAAFREAARFGCGAECDVRLPVDGVPMVFHDRDLRRLCGSSEEVAHLDSGDLASRRLAGTAETVPALWELLERWPTYLPLLIEAKSEEGRGSRVACAVAGEVVQLDSFDHLAVMSFDPEVGAELEREMPEVRRGLVVDAEWTEARRAEALARSRPHFLAIDRRLAGSPWTAEMRRRMPVYAWTIISAAQRSDLRTGVDALIWEGDGRP
jgi:glycerophosphoryl diester phosphodiesterase